MISNSDATLFECISNRPEQIQELFDFLIDGSGIAVIAIDSNFSIIYHNRYFSDLLDIKKNIIGYKIEEVFPNIHNSFSQTHYFYEKLFINFHLNSKTLDFCNKRITILTFSKHLPSLGTDNSPSEQIINKHIYSKVISNIDEGVQAIDQNGIMFLYNNQMENIEGLKSSEVIGKNVNDIYVFSKQPSLLLKVLKEGKPIYNFHQDFTTRNGKYVNAIITCIPLFFSGEVRGAIAIVKDYSTFRDMTEKMLELHHQLSEDISNSKDTTTSINNSLKYELIGEDEAFLECIEWAKSASNSNSSVMLFGETGTGKELFAKLIHFSSERSKGPYLTLNCAAIPDNLLESLLFGTVKGAYTDARDKAGLIEQSNNGTLFLDEINSMSIKLQSKLLRVLEEKKIRKLGGKTEIDINVRFISSCNVDPQTAIKNHELRSDIFYRLAVLYIPIPSLRKRIDDIHLLTSFFIKQYNELMNKNVIDISNDVLRHFNGYDWPGNVRQLKHTIESAMTIISSNEPFIEMQHIPYHMNISNSSSKYTEIKNEKIPENEKSLFEIIESQKKDKIIEALMNSQGNITKAAAELGISRQNLQHKLKKYNLK